MIVEEDQKGNDRAEYGNYILKHISKNLTNYFGKGFSVTNLKYRRRFYKAFQKGQTLYDQLSCSHYLLLSKIEEENKIKFYFNEAIASNWSVRELERQIASLLYERLVLSKNKEEVLQLANKGYKINNPADLVKDPYILEFLLE